MYYGDAMQDWKGFSGGNIELGTNVNAISFFAYSDKDFESTLQMWLVTDTNGDLYSTNTITYKQGWNKYTFNFGTEFSVVKTYTFSLKTVVQSDGGQWVYVDDIYFFNDSQA